tara:strand:+ start:263 stop:478 length:216 start_codon:yes stop_codon:yes gene_type:complete
MKTFKQFQENIFDFLPKGKTLNRGVGGSLPDKEKKRYNMPIIKTKPPSGGYRMPMPPQPTTKPYPYKTTLV